MSSSFLAYARTGAHELTGSAPSSGARRGGKVQLLLSPLAGGAALPADVGFELLGPADVVGLNLRAITRRYPLPGTTDALSELLVLVEFEDADLPWRYSPHGVTNGAMRPWLALLVGLDGPEISLVGKSRVSVSAAVLEACKLTENHLYAHVHQTESPSLSRLLCPRALQPNQRYRAALVPAFRVDGQNNIVDAWPHPAPGAIELPLYDSWTFATGEDDDFPTLASRLQMKTAEELQALPGSRFGATELRLADQAASEAVTMLGALAASDATDATPAPSVRAWSELVDAGGRWVLGPPQYDEPWRTTPLASAGWPTELRDDPRRRIAAGLGAFCAIEHQQELADGARKQAGALELAAHDLRSLGLGLAAGKSLFSRRVPSAADGVARLTTLGSLLRRLPARNGGTADRALLDRTPRLHPALLSGALRRMIRPGSSIATLAKEPPSVAGLLEAANRCPDRERPSSFTRVLCGGNGEAPQDQLREVIARWPQLRELGEQLMRDARLLAQQSREAAQRLERTRCKPVDLAGLGNLIAKAVDPRQPDPPARRQVLGRYRGLEEAQPVIEPELDLPLALALKELSPQWLLPGRGELPTDSIVPMATNPRFTEAALVGANQRTLAELRWRNVRVRSGWSPLRHFWPRHDGPDVSPLREWGATALGDPSHVPPGLPPSLLVVVIRSAILRRFPSTAIYLLKAEADPKVLRQGDEDALSQAILANPIFKGAIESDLHYIGFPITPAAAAKALLVLEEPRTKPRFALKSANAPDAAKFAEKNFYPRTIAVIPLPAEP